MFCSRLAVSSMAGLVSLAAHAGTGLQPPAGNDLWPALQARISVQTANLPTLGLGGDASLALAPGAASGGVQGASFFGDYYFARPSFGGFRATSGVLMGGQAGLPLLNASSGGRLGLAVNRNNWGLPAGADAATPLPYLGLGFSSNPGGAGWSLNADLGLVAENSIGGLRRALGVQGLENARRELRLSPVLQVGWRYSF